MNRPLITFLVLLIILFTSSANAQLSGNYTINPSGSGNRNYQSVVAAENALNTFGISGPVIFYIADSTYTGAIRFNSAITGASSKNTITFEGKSGAANRVVIKANKGITLHLIRTTWIEFKNLTISFNGTQGRCVYLWNTNNVTFSDCIIKNVATSGSALQSYFGDSLFVRNTIIRSSDMGVFLDASATRRHFASFIGSSIKGCSNRAFTSMYGKDLHVEGCLIDSCDYAFTANYGHRSKVLNNRFLSGAFYFINENALNTNAKDTSYFVNNMIVNHENEYVYSAFSAARMTRTKFYHNSINTSAGYTGIIMDDPSGSRILNNNFKSNGKYGMTIVFTTSSEPTEFDYNNFDLIGRTNFIKFGNTSANSFKGLQLIDARFNSKSLSKPARFITETNLKTSSSGLNNEAKITEFLKDIDNNPRPANGDKYPDIGCNEYNVPAIDLAVTDLISPLSISRSATEIKARFHNSGYSTISNFPLVFSYSVDSGITWTNENDTLIGFKSDSTYDFSFSKKWLTNRTGQFQIRIKVTYFRNSLPITVEKSFDICSGLAGVYTVGHAISDYPDIAEAIAAAELCGCKSSTTFLLEPGQYGRLEIDSIKGLSDTISLIIDGQYTDSVFFRHC